VVHAKIMKLCLHFVEVMQKKLWLRIFPDTVYSSLNVDGGYRGYAVR